MNDDDQKNELISVSMQIILHAGNAGNLADEAYKYAKEENLKLVDETFQRAKKELVLAHESQTHVIQGEANGTDYQYSPLFAHAQDTLMTISIKLNLIEKLVDIIKMIKESN